mmetsp:Transcript_14043/g.23280  ORF Transcript_14043/g.23280 Transcript_14043/m.23280 type:complete len:282 (+) Transcript_14043:21-866(+)
MLQINLSVLLTVAQARAQWSVSNLWGGIQAVSQNMPSARQPPPSYPAQIVTRHPHDMTAFTQGLYYERQGTLVESTGLYGDSSVRRVDIASGQVLQKESLPSFWFGEGITMARGVCIQLLWREGLGLIRDPRSFTLKRTFPLPQGMAEGWGLTHDGAGTLFASDGTSEVQVLDAATLQTRRCIGVHAAGKPLGQLNELQWVHGKIWANVFREDRIAVFDPSSGEVEYFVDCSALLDATARARLGFEDVLNGIAYDVAGDRMFVTGKCWPFLFQIRLPSQCR